MEYLLKKSRILNRYYLYKNGKKDKNFFIIENSDYSYWVVVNKEVVSYLTFDGDLTIQMSKSKLIEKGTVAIYSTSDGRTIHVDLGNKNKYPTIAPRYLLRDSSFGDLDVELHTTMFTKNQYSISTSNTQKDLIMTYFGIILFYRNCRDTRTY
jgi:hypothetical protein